MGLKKVQEKEFAKVLFVSENLDQKVVAARVGVTEKTLIKWIEDGGWRKLKKSLLNTRHQNLALLYDQLDWLNNHIKTRKPIYACPKDLIDTVKAIDENGVIVEKFVTVKETDYPLLKGNAATPAEADSLLKLSAAINRLEFETGVGETVNVLMQLTDLIQQTDFELSKKIIPFSDLLIQNKMK